MIIVFGGICIGVCIFSNFRDLEKVQVKLLSVPVKEGTGVHDESIDANGKLHISHAEATVYDLQKIEESRSEFNIAYAKYVRNGQLIALLPLLGILGTVWGLMEGSGSPDISGLMSGLGTAMMTTFIGLSFSIVLKFIDAAVIGVKVNAIDADFASKDAIIQRQTLMREAATVRKTNPPEAPK